MLHDGHRARLKQRFLQEGLDPFEPHNVLELLLFFSVPRQDTNEFAHRLINAFGSLSAAFDAPYEELLKVKGIGENSAVLLKMIPDLCRRYLDDKAGDIKSIHKTQDAVDFLMPKFIGHTDERVVLICLDNKCVIKNCSTVSQGTVNITDVNLRKIMELCMRHQSTAAILSHNHPHGMPVPSKSDLDTTRSLVTALESVGVKLIDHIIFANEEYYSMADSNAFGALFI